MVQRGPSGGHDPGEGDWLSLREARSLLDVSDTTLRQWADDGHLRVYRTPGGHRRFLREDVESLTKAPRPPQESDSRDAREAPALRRIRRRLSQDRVTQQPWFQAIAGGSARGSNEGPEGHDRMRLFGRRLLSLLMQEPGPRRRRLELLAEARVLGQEYGSEMLERNVSLTDTVEAFVFFRTMVLDSSDTGSWSSILETSDRVLAGVCSSYQQAAPPVSSSRPAISPGARIQDR